MEGTIRCSANYVPLSPISFLDRARSLRRRTFVVYGDIQYTWQQTRDRCIRLASALSSLCLSRHDVIILRLKKLGFNVMAAYGCTEVYGAGTACLWMPEWETLREEECSRLKARHGLNHFAMEAVDVVDPTTMNSVPHDGKTIGEIVLRGNTVMSGYFKDKEATEAAFRGGWFWSRDMGVIDPDGYIHLKDRSQDVITCGGEIVGSTEIEGLLYSHPAVYEAAVVGRPDEALGESMCAFVKLKEGVEAKEEEITEFCERNLVNKNIKMVPKTVVFSDLPKTSTGKTQKNVLKKMAKDMGYIPLNAAD